MENREVYNLDHASHMVGKIGRLQTLSMIPVVAGDSMELAISGVFRLAPLRRQLVLDAMLDLFVFYVPHRHIYGDDWTDFIQQGIDETVTFPVGPTPTAGLSPEYLGDPKGTYSARPMPLYKTASYANIYNFYFRAQTDNGPRLQSQTHLETDENGVQYGSTIGRLKSLWTSTINQAVLPDADDREVDVTSGTFDILDLTRIKARYKTEQQRAYMDQQYTDVMSGTWGSGVNIDADQRPELCHHQRNWLSGYDVDGTSEISLGTYSGKSATVVNAQMKRKHFAEHGTLWVMAAVRFPIVHQSETHYLARVTQPDYKEFAGDPTILAAEEPTELNNLRVFAEPNSPQSLGMIPYGNWYRTQPSIVHGRFRFVQGYSFLKTLPTTFDLANYCQDREYDDAFQTQQLGDWTSDMKIGLQAHRYIPAARTSVFAGT